jgi:hypothetical protein
MSIEHSRLLAEVERLPRTERSLPGACAEWSVKDLLAHLDAWNEMFLTWVAQGAAGGTPIVPAKGHTWKTTPALNDEIWRRTREDEYDEVMARLHDSHSRVQTVVENYSDDLFTPGRLAWTGTTSVGAYAASVTASHSAWASKLVRKFSNARELAR